MMNRRIKRMFDICEKAEKIIFIHYESQNYKFMAIDTDFHDLRDFRKLESVLLKKFGDKYEFNRFYDTESLSEYLISLGSV